MSINPVNGTNSGTSSAATGVAAGGINALNMGDFLTLMTTQLKNQNPLQPVDSSTFLNEMAQMSTVEGVTSMQSSLSTLSNSLLASSAISSASLVGRDVLATAGSSTYTSGTTLHGAVNVPDGATGVTLNVQNSTGEVVKQISVPAGSGLESFSWDGSTSSGSAAPSGTYTFSASASVNGANKTVPTLLPGTVSTVSIDPSTNAVTLNTSQLGPVAMSAVTQID